VAGTLVVDGNNVVGAAADGWWRDRPAAVRRLLGRLQCYARTIDDAVVLVLDVPQADLAEGVADGVTVRYASRKGRDAADDRIRELIDEGVATPVIVVTSDRALADDARSRGATVVGAGSMLKSLDTAGC
jgi:predicted RNA-binding protein with PIN domain